MAAGFMSIEKRRQKFINSFPPGTLVTNGINTGKIIGDQRIFVDPSDDMVMVETENGYALFSINNLKKI